MSSSNPLRLTLFLVVFTAILGAISVAKGGLYVSAHEGDTYHLLDILLRMAEGQRPHLDFVTPIGVLAFAPIVLFVDMGFGVGVSTLYSQVFVAACLLPVAAYAYLRLPAIVGYLFGAFTLGIVLALTYGGPSSKVSISMHYNRWAWAVTFLLLVLALIPAKTPRERVDGALLGLLGAALLLTKVTFFVGVLPGAMLYLWASGRRSALGWALGSGLVTLAVATVILGPAHWPGYLSDLLLVFRSEIRPSVGLPFGAVISGAPYLGGTLAILGAVLLFRTAGRNVEAGALALLALGFLYIVYQNFGNDSAWLPLLAVILLVWRERLGQGSAFGVERQTLAALVAFAALVLYLPSFVNLTKSPVRHLSLPEKRFVKMLPAQVAHDDVFLRFDRAYTMTAEVALDTQGSVWEGYGHEIGRAEPATLGGITFPTCELIAGSLAWLETVTDDLARAGIPENSQIMNVDILTVFWLFGPFAPLENGAPWYYGNLTGLQNADYVLVPKCRFVTRVNLITLDELKESGRTFTPVRDNDLYALFEVSQP